VLLLELPLLELLLLDLPLLRKLLELLLPELPLLKLLLLPFALKLSILRIEVGRISTVIVLAPRIPAIKAIPTKGKAAIAIIAIAIAAIVATVAVRAATDRTALTACQNGNHQEQNQPHVLPQQLGRANLSPATANTRERIVPKLLLDLRDHALLAKGSTSGPDSVDIGMRNVGDKGRSLTFREPT
jgi:hypothetical protein